MKEAGRRSRAARGGLEAGAAALNRSAAGAVQSRAALGFGTMTVVLYWMSISHPSQVARKMGWRRWVVRAQRLPIPALTAQAIRPAVEWYVRTVETDGRRATAAQVRADLSALPALLDQVDRLLGDGTLTVDPPNAATL